MAKIIPYDPNLKKLAAQLRKNMTYGEVLLGNQLKSGEMLGFDFDRQRCIDKYIVDFYCKELMLAIEVDGKSHDGVEAFQKDQVRELKLHELGVFVLRFTESDVKYEMENVLRVIEHQILVLIRSDQSIELPEDFDQSLLDQ